jgi:hypothetical protein
VRTNDGAVRTGHYRLITTLLDPRIAPAAALAATYAKRWACETGFREIKTYLRGSHRALRATDPEVARQELWAYLVVYQAIRLIICHAALRGANLEPARISFYRRPRRRPKRDHYHTPAHRGTRRTDLHRLIPAPGHQTRHLPDLPTHRKQATISLPLQTGIHRAHLTKRVLPAFHQHPRPRRRTTATPKQTARSTPRRSTATRRLSCWHWVRSPRATRRS